MAATLERTSRVGETQRTYTPREVEAGLQLAATLGNAAAAAEKLKMPAETLQHWIRHNHRDRYLEIRAELAPKIHAQIAAETEDLAYEITDAAREALTRTRQEIPNLAGKDAAAAVKNLVFAQGSAIEKSLLIRGKPTSIIETQNVDVLLRKLQAGGIVTVEAEEITDADVVKHQ